MWEAYHDVVQKYYPRLTLSEERRLIALAQSGLKDSADELVLRHIGFVMFRLRRKVFRVHLERHGEDLLAATIPVLYQKVASYNLSYRTRAGTLKPVKFASYIWKRIDGFVLDYLNKERRLEFPLDDAHFSS